LAGVALPRWIVSLPLLALACSSGKARRDGSADVARDQSADQANDSITGGHDGADATVGDGPADGPRDLGLEALADTGDGGPGDGGLLDGGPDGGGDASDAAVPSCVQQGSLWFAAPQPMFAPGGGREFAIAATSKRRVGAMAGWNGRAGVFYFDSLDGGRSFRPTMQLSTFGPANVGIAAGPDHIYLATAGPSASVVLWLAPFANLSDVSQFSGIQFGPPGNYVGQPVAGRDGRVAMFIENYTGDALDGIEGQWVSTADGPTGPFSEPQWLFWPSVCAGGLYHSNGTLFMSDGVDTLASGYQMEMRWSTDNGATFSGPVIRPSSGGQIWCPKVYELTSGTVLVVVREGYILGSTQRLVGAPFDPVTHQFGQAQVIANGYLRCVDSARTGTGRLYVSITMGDITKPIEGTVLTFSDDDGRTWSAPQPLWGIEPGEGCPKLAASDDELYLLWSRGQTLMFGRVGNASACDEAPAP
jgi:hypothetical protein